MRIGSVTSAPNVHGALDPQHIHGTALHGTRPVVRTSADYPDQDPLDHLTAADRALLARLQAGVVDLDAASGTAVAALAREIAHLRAAGLVPGGRELTSEELGLLVRMAMGIAVRPMPAEVHARVVALLPRRGGLARVDVLL